MNVRIINVGIFYDSIIFINIFVVVVVVASFVTNLSQVT